MSRQQLPRERTYEPFQKTNTEGQLVEREIAGHLYTGGFGVRRSNAGKHQDMLVWGEGLFHRVEVKCEKRQRFVNVCVEFSQVPKSIGHRVPSGIAASSANIWVHVFDEKIVAYIAASMRCWIDEQKATGAYRAIICGDRENENVLVPISDIDGKLWSYVGPPRSISSSCIWSN